MDRLTEQRGYTLFLTVLIIVIFSILSVTLITVTLTGAKRSEVREDVTQAGELAEKGLKHLMQQIEHELQKEVQKYENQDGLKKAHFVELIEQTVDKYSCSNELLSIDSETGHYEACVDEYVDRGKVDHLPQRVILKTLGIANEKEKNLFAVLELGGNAIDDDMEYVINVFNKSNCSANNCLPGEGNLFLHGGTSIQGDINVERNLFVSDKSFERYLYNHAIKTTFPMTRIKPNNEKSRIIVGNSIYKFNVENKASPSRSTRISGNFDYEEHIGLVDNIPNNSRYTKVDTIDENVFHEDFLPELSERSDHPGYNELKISEELSEKEQEYKQNLYNRFVEGDQGVHVYNTNIFDSKGVDRVILNADLPNSKVFPKQYGNDSGTFRIRGKSTFKQFSTNGHILINPVVGRRNIVEFKESAYIHGNLEIRGDTEVKGPIYVNGNLKVENDLNNDIKIDSEIYVNGDATINAKNLTMDTKLFVNGNLKITSVNTIISGPIYVNGKLEVDGGLYKDNDLTMNNVLYVGKDVQIKHILYDPTLLDSVRGDHIVYANGKIKLERINRFERQAVKLNAYYYSNESIEIDGNESKIIINGGIAAPRIVLNAIRGNSNAFTKGAVERPSRQITWGEVPLRYFDGTEPQDKMESRLQINYDDYVFKKYSHLLLEGRITKVMPGKITQLSYNKQELIY